MQSNRSKSLRAKTSFLTLALWASVSWAGQVIDCGDDRSHVVDISLKELTRLSVDGDRIRRMDFPEGELQVSQDRSLGVAYLRVAVPKPVNAFVTATSGQSCALVLQPKDMPLETIQLRFPRRLDDEARRAGAGGEKAEARAIAARKLIYAMARGERPNSYEVAAANRLVQIYNEVQFRLVAVYTGTAWVGEHYSLVNVTKAQLRLAEQEFYKPGVMSISIENQVLEPGEQTEVFIVKQGQED